MAKFGFRIPKCLLLTLKMLYEIAMHLSVIKRDVRVSKKSKLDALDQENLANDPKMMRDKPLPQTT